MKWLVLCVLLCLAKLGASCVLRDCHPMKLDNEQSSKENNSPNRRQHTKESHSRKKSATYEPECLAGTRWESNCHNCQCSEEGLALCTRQMVCDQPLADPIKCKPESVIVRDCNSCICLESGLGLCTLKICSSFHQSERTSAIVKGKDCAPGSSWKSKCDRCKCSPEGVPVCEVDLKCNVLFPSPEMNCAPGTLWRNECNMCRCFGGRPFCTIKACEGTGNEWTGPELMQTTETTEHTEPTQATETKETTKTLESTETMDTNQTQEEIPSPEEEFEVNTTTGKIEKYLNKPLPNAQNSLAQLNIREFKDKAEERIFNVNNGNVDEFRVTVGEPDEKKEQNSNDLNYGNVEELEDNSTELENKAYQDKTARTRNTHVILKRSVCKPNQAFQSECNYCKCAADGQSYTCTHNECMEGETNREVEVFMESEGTDHIEKHSVCKPHGTFYIGCNTCHCNYFGTDYSCTNRPCPLPEDVELFHELKMTKSSSKNKTQKIVCVANRMFIKDCNTCWCNDDGTGFFCTRKVCVPEIPDDASGLEDKKENLRIIEKECRPYEVFELDCNMCRCNPDGKSFSCTRRACVESVDEENKDVITERKKRDTKEPPKTCQPGQEFRMDCNKCLCDNEGQEFSCTRNDCNALNNHFSPTSDSTRTKRETSKNVTVCTPGAVFNMDCNECTCTEDGANAICTMNRCPEQNEKKNETDKAEKATTDPEADPNFRCNPGEQFKRGCNDCSCSADGKSVFCTVMFCDQDVSSTTI